MRRATRKVVCLALAAMILLTLTSVVSCGGEEEEEAGNKVIYGFEWDFTGRASLGVTQTYDGIMAYLAMAEEENLLPEGLGVKVITYDTKSDPGRVPVGYLWLKGQGANLMSLAPHDMELMRSRAEEERMPFFNGSSMASLLDSEWLTFIYGPPESQLEILLPWVTDNWDYASEGRRPRIGAVTLAGVPFYEMQVAKAESIAAANPDKIEWAGAQKAPTTTMTWAAEISRLIDCDWIIAAISGPSLASFTGQARAKGYDGRLIGPFESFWSFWELVRATTSKEDLDGVVTGSYFPWWTHTGSFISKLKQDVEEHCSQGEKESVYLGTGRITGWAMGIALVEIIRKAAENVGAENVDSEALRDAMFQVEVTVEGWGNVWKPEPGMNLFAKAVTIHEYEANQDEWVNIAGWAIPPSLGG